MPAIRPTPLKIIPGFIFTKSVKWRQPVLDGNGDQEFDTNGQPMWQPVDTTGATAEFAVGLQYQQPPPYAVDLDGSLGSYGQVTVDNQGVFTLSMNPDGTARVKSNMVYQLVCIMPGNVRVPILMGPVVTS